MSAPAKAQGLALAAAVGMGGLLLLGLAIHGSLVESEGAFLYGARRVAEGGWPYRDFLLPGMPYAVYAYVPAGASLLSARLVSVLLATCALGVFAWIVRPQGWAGVAAALLLATSMTFSAGAVLVGPYALALLAASAAFLLARSGRCFLGGLAAGVAAGAHASFLPLIPVLALWPLLRGAGRRPALRCAAGAALALIPCLVFIATAPSPWLAELQDAGAPRPVPLLLRPQWIVLWMLAAVGTARRRTPESLAALACALAVGILGFALAPRSPTALLPALPFLLLTAIPSMDLPLTRPWVLAGFALWVLFLSHRGREYETQVSQSHSMSPEMVEGVADALRRHARPGDTVLAFWPGYAALSGLRLPAGMEAYRGPAAATPVDRWIRERRHRVVQIGRQGQAAVETARLIALLDAAGYERVFNQWDRYVFRVRE